MNRYPSFPAAAVRFGPGLAAWLLLAAAPASGQPARLDARIRQSVQRHEAAIVELRHRIHQNPELGNREFETARLVAEHLRALGYEVRTGVAHTGVVAFLPGGRPGPVVAVRADMDALPVTEQTDFPFRSTKRDTWGGMEVGVMHACGHDMHTSILMGVSSVLADLKADLSGGVLLIFQPAEEGPPAGEEGGADLMLREGAFDQHPPAAVFALHSYPDLDVGSIGYTSGAALASSDRFQITVTGRQSHAAAPHQGIDPVVTAAQLVLALQTIPSRTLDPLQPCVLTVGMIHGGERFNIIPEQVMLEGTVRTYDPGVQDIVERRMREIGEGITRAAGATFELAYLRGNPPTINDPTLVQSALPTLQAVLGVDHVIASPPVMAAEDFSLFARRVPGLFIWLGVHAPGTVTGPLHSPIMRADDSAIPVGMRVLSNLVVDYLAGAGRRR
jgi:amidohydrolase